MFLPFLLLSLVSNGVMPQRMAEGVVLVICTGDGPLAIAVDPDSGKPAEKAPDTRSGRCDWANATPPATLCPPLQLPARQAGAAVEILPVTPLVLIAGRATGLPPSTGPPAVI